MMIIVTGCAGFIGSSFVIKALHNDRILRIIGLDKFTYAGNMDNLRLLKNNPRFRVVKGDICDIQKDVHTGRLKDCDLIVNFAAESHVDRSIKSSDAFVKSNILGVQHLLEACRKYDIKFMQISTDEVYGSTDNTFTEQSPLRPSNPYAASKAAADLLAISYHKTYGLPVIVTRSCNNYGPRQHREKLIPKMITNAMQDKKLPVYGDGSNVREWVHVFDNCDAIQRVLDYAKPGEIYNIGSGIEKTNIEVVEAILKELDKPKQLIEFVKDRLGHDRRYALDSTKIKQLGWQPKISFDNGIRSTVRWYRENEQMSNHSCR